MQTKERTEVGERNTWYLLQPRRAISRRYLFRLHKRRNGTLERFSDGPQQFSLTFLNHAVRADDTDAGLQHVLFNLRHGDRDAVQRGTDLFHATTVAWQ